MSLEGLHETWIQCGESRQVNFSELPPGDYTFRVIGANGDGVWNRVGDSLSIHINPPYWQTPLFYVMLILAFGLAFGLFHQYRVKTKVERVKDLERVRKNAAADFVSFESVFSRGSAENLRAFLVRSAKPSFRKTRTRLSNNFAFSRNIA